MKVQDVAENGLLYKIQKEGGFMLKLPKGNSNFIDIVTKGFVYVDKTNYIEMLENGNDKFVHFLRPRRFGKTLSKNRQKTPTSTATSKLEYTLCTLWA